MAPGRRVKAGAHGFAIADAFAHLRVELGDIVRIFRGHLFGHLTLFAGDWELGEGVVTARAFQRECLALHRVVLSRHRHQIALFAMDLKQEMGTARHAAPHPKRHDGTVPAMPLTATWSGTVLASTSPVPATGIRLRLLTTKADSSRNSPRQWHSASAVWPPVIVKRLAPLAQSA